MMYLDSVFKQQRQLNKEKKNPLKKYPSNIKSQVLPYLKKVSNLSYRQEARESLQRSTYAKPTHFTSIKQFAPSNIRASLPQKRQLKQADQSFDDNQLTNKTQIQHIETVHYTEEEEIKCDKEDYSQNIINNLDHDYEQVEEANDQAIKLNDGVKFYHPIVKGKETLFVVPRDTKPKKIIKHVQLGRTNEQNYKSDQKETVNIMSSPKRLEVYGSYPEQIKSPKSNKVPVIDENFYMQGRLEGYEMDDQSQSGLFLNEYITDKNRGDINSRDLRNNIAEEIQYHYQDYFPTDGSEPIPLQNSVNHQNWLLQQQQLPNNPPVEENKNMPNTKISSQDQRNDKSKPFK